MSANYIDRMPTVKEYSSITRLCEWCIQRLGANLATRFIHDDPNQAKEAYRYAILLGEQHYARVFF